MYEAKPVYVRILGKSCSSQEGSTQGVTGAKKRVSREPGAPGSMVKVGIPGGIRPQVLEGGAGPF